MPRNVRNFWLSLSVDGKRTKVETGPVSKSGGFDLEIRMRDRGGITYAGTLTGQADGHGNLSLRFSPKVATLTEGVDVLIPGQR
jgi:hypothetical protein